MVFMRVVHVFSFSQATYVGPQAQCASHVGLWCPSMLGFASEHGGLPRQCSLSTRNVRMSRGCAEAPCVQDIDAVEIFSGVGSVSAALKDIGLAPVGRCGSSLRAVALGRAFSLFLVRFGGHPGIFRSGALSLEISSAWMTC